MPAVQITVDQESSANVGSRIDEELEIGMRRYWAGEMMIEVQAVRTTRKLSLQCEGVACEADIEHREFVSGLCLYALEQGDVAFDSGNEHARPWLVKPQLMQRTKTVRIAVENIIKYRHEFE